MQRASVTTEVISATLNAGQAIILSVGLTAALCLAARGGASAAGMVVTAGDLVSVQCVLKPILPSSQLLPGCMALLTTSCAVEAWHSQGGGTRGRYKLQNTMLCFLRQSAMCALHATATSRLFECWLSQAVSACTSQHRQSACGFSPNSPLAQVCLKQLVCGMQNDPLLQGMVQGLLQQVYHILQAQNLACSYC